VLDIQSELMFVNGMVHLLQELNFGTPTTFLSPATSSPLTATYEVIFLHVRKLGDIGSINTPFSHLLGSYNT